MIEEFNPLHHRRGAIQPESQANLFLLPCGDQHAIVLPGQVEQRLAVDPVIGLHLDAQREDAIYLFLNNVFGQPELGNACPQEPANLAARFVDSDAVTEACQVVRRSEARRPGTDDSNFLGALGTLLGRHLPVIAGIALHLAHVDGAVDLDAIARLHARCGTCTPADRREWRRTKQDLERFVRLLVGQRIQETLHVVARGADVVARRDELLPVRLLGRP